MLVLSRRPGETIRFPTLGVSVSIVSAQGQRIRVGIDAPPEIHIVRGELLDSEGEASTRTVAERHAPTPRKDRREVHELKNRLNTAMLGLFLAQKQLAKGEPEVADQTLSAALQRLAELEQNAAALPVHRSGTRARATGTAHISLSHSRFASWCRCPAGGRRSQRTGSPAWPAGNGRLHRGRRQQRRRSPPLPLRHEARFVLLDMAMPECDGPETLRQIRANSTLQDLTVYAVSGSTPATVDLPAGSAGVADWFAKPLDPRRLMEHLRHAV